MQYPHAVRPYVVLGMMLLVSSCTKPTPIEVFCEAQAQQYAHCGVKSLPGARIEIRGGEQALGPALELPADTSSGEIQLAYGGVPFEVGALTFVATAKQHSPGTATWKLPPVRYRATLTGHDLRFDVPKGESIRWNDAPMTVSSDGGFHFHVEEIGDLGAEEVDHFPERQYRLTVANERGESLAETLRFAPSDDELHALREQIRQRGAPLAWASPYQHKGPRPGILVDRSDYSGITLRPLGGLKKISEAQVVVFAEPQDRVDLGSCGIYQNSQGAMVPLGRVRMHRDVEAFEARTGRSIVKKTIYGSAPRECREREKFNSIDGTPLPDAIEGSNVDAAALSAWVDSLP